MLSKCNSPNSTALFAYFFFSGTKPGLVSLSDAWRALLAQIFQRAPDDTDFLDIISFAMRDPGQAQLRGSSAVIRDIVCLELSRKSSKYIVLDGLDECDADEDATRQFYESIVGTGAKTLIFSRPSVSFLRRFAEQQSIPTVQVTPELVGGDLRMFLSHRVEKMIEEGYLPATSSTNVKELVEMLATGANGMFLWARLMFVFLKSPVLAPPHQAPQVRLRYIRELRYPESLDRIYCRILTLFQEAPPYQRDLARRVFMWLLFQKEHMKASQLHDILSATDPTPDSDAMQLDHPGAIQESQGTEFEPMKEAILMGCLDLVEISHTENRGLFYSFVHMSVAEFFLARFKSPIPRVILDSTIYDLFDFCPFEAETQLSTACLLYLTTRVPQRPLAGRLLEKADKKHIEICFPFLSYAASHWSKHMAHEIPCCSHDSGLEITVSALDHLQAFLTSKLTLMVWVEALYTMVSKERFAAMLRHLHDWSNWAQSNLQPLLDADYDTLPADMHELSNELQNLKVTWDEALTESPEEIWNDVTAFTKSRFFAQTKGTVYNSLAPMPLPSWDYAEAPLSTISSTFDSGSVVGVLSIWPPK
jgi:hypothetical protein